MYHNFSHDISYITKFHETSPSLRYVIKESLTWSPLLFVQSVSNRFVTLFFTPSQLFLNGRRSFLNHIDRHKRVKSYQSHKSSRDVPPLVFTQLEVFKAVKSFRKGSAPGPSGLRPEHLKVAVKSPSPNRSDKALEALTKLVNVMAAGKVPAEVSRYLCGARLHAALKKDGGIRPIAVGNILRRLTSKLVAVRLAQKAATKLAPHQLGVGVRGGCEGIVHTVRQVLEQNPEKWLLQVDLINAFNLANRDAGFREVEQHFPECLAWLLNCYGGDSELMLGDKVLLSSLGWHQGCPLAGLAFSLTLQPILEMIQEEVPTLDVNAWYLDDGTLVGTKDELQAVVDILQREGPARGLHLSTSASVQAPALPKSSVWCPGDLSSRGEDPLARGIPRVRKAGVMVLGAPVGSNQFVRDALERRVRKIQEITAHLPLLKDPHTEFTLLRSCLSLPKVMFSLRTVDTTVHQSVLQDFDDVTRGGLDRILGVPVTALQWAQAKLPVGMGGLGLRAAEDHAPAAYVTSYLSSQPISRGIRGLPALADVEGRQSGEEEPEDRDQEAREQEDREQEDPVFLPQPLLDLLSAKQGEEATAESLQGVTQKMASFTIDKSNQTLLSNLIRESGEREIARLASLSLPHAGDWLNVVPCPALGLHLRGPEFITSVKYRLGAFIYTTAGPCPACQRESDRLGCHSLCCGTNGERIGRHNNLRDILYSTAVSAALGPSKESRFLLPGSDRRPGDLLIPHWVAGRDCAMDLTVIHPLQEATVAGAATTPGYAADIAHKNKIRDSLEDCERQGIAFIPLAVESLGGWHPVAVKEIKRIGSALARHTGQPEGDAIRHLFQRLAVSLAKWNAALFLNRVPTFPHPTIDGVE